MNITLEGEVASRQPDSIPKRKTRNEKRLRNAAIAFSYRHYIGAAYLAGRVHHGLRVSCVTVVQKIALAFNRRSGAAAFQVRMPLQHQRRGQQIGERPPE